MSEGKTTQEQIMDQDARQHWETSRKFWFCQDHDRIARAGTSAKEYHKYELIRKLLNLIEYPAGDPDPSDEGECEAVAIADVIREYLTKNWTQHQAARLAILQEENRQ